MGNLAFDVFFDCRAYDAILLGMNLDYNYDVHIVALSCRFLFVCFVALRPKSTAMVMAGRSVHLTTLFPG